MKKISILIIITLCTVNIASSQNASLFQKATYINGVDTMLYRILLPVDYDSTKQYPLIIFLHGSGERGNDNESQLRHGSWLFLDSANRVNFPAFVVFPQCPRNSYWSNAFVKVDTSNAPRVYEFWKDGEPRKAMAMLLQLTDELIGIYPVQMKQVYVGGLSMGGMGTFELVRRKPELFAAAFPICGGANPETADQLTKPVWWIFHGGKDATVPYIYSEKMAEALLHAGAAVKLTIYPDAGHNSWDNAFAEQSLLSWLFAQKKY